MQGVVEVDADKIRSWPMREADRDDDFKVGILVVVEDSLTFDKYQIGISSVFVR